jgi:Na+/melibiose symporter-like transporter
MQEMNEWPLWQWALFTNVVGAVGICLGFLSGTKVSADLRVYVAVFTIVCLNLLFLVVRPRMAAARAEGKSPNAVGILYEVLTERPILTIVSLLQLVGAARSTATTVQFLQATTTTYVRNLPNLESVITRLILGSISMGIVALLWWLGAVGLWIGRKWAWWLALLLNALAASTSGIVQLLKLNQWLFDPWSTVAVVLLLLPSVRRRLGTAPEIGTVAPDR